MQYEIIGLDECGSEMVFYSGTKRECTRKMSTIREEYPECRGFQVQRNAREVAYERASHLMNSDMYDMY